MATATHRLGTTTEAGAEHGVSGETIRRWFKLGLIRGRMVGGRLLIDLDSVKRPKGASRV